MDFLSGVKVLEEKQSKFNGKVTVVKSLGLGTYIQVDGLTQSGGVVTDIWKETLKKVHSAKRIVHSCLILGLGGGSVAKLVRKYWPETEITGVDIDPVIVKLGIRHLGLGNSKAEIIVNDAAQFVRISSKSKKKWDLVIIDMYKGYEVPEKFTKDSFLKLILSLLSDNGIAVFNRLYFGEKRKEAMKFGETLQKYFKVDYLFPEANVMFLCRK